MKLIHLTQRTPDWQTWRSQGVTASEAPIILGRSPYKTPWLLWAERTGVRPAEDLSNNPNVQRGIAYEDQVRQGFEARHDTLLLPLCAESSEHPILRCSLDGQSNDNEPVELKVPTERTYQTLVAQEREATAYQLAWVQLQFQLYVTEAEQGWLVFDPCRPGMPSLEFAVPRDEPFIRQDLVPACLAFWEAVQRGIEPERDTEQDGYMPAGAELVRWTQTAERYRQLQAQRQQLEAQLKQLKTQQAKTEQVFVALMGEYRQAEAAGLQVTRYRQRGSVDYAAVVEAVVPGLDPTLLEQHRRKASERVKVTLQEPEAHQEQAEPAVSVPMQPPIQPQPQPPRHQPAASFYF